MLPRWRAAFGRSRPGAARRGIFPLAAALLGIALLPSASTRAAGEAGPVAAPLLRSGDLIARRGSGLFSDRFAAASPHDQRFSHLGVLVRRDHGWSVIHALADDRSGQGGVREDPLATFLAGRPPHACFRIRLSEPQRKAFLAQLDADVRRHLPFDSDFRLDDADRVYCTELVWCALCRATGTDPAPLKPRLFGRPVLTIESITTGSPLVEELRGTDGAL
jgi:hypothetical protein